MDDVEHTISDWEWAVYELEAWYGAEYVPQYTDEEREYIREKLIPALVKAMNPYDAGKRVDIAYGLGEGDPDGIRLIEKYLKDCPGIDRELINSIIDKARAAWEKRMRENPEPHQPWAKDPYLW